MSDTSLLEHHIVELLQTNCEKPADALNVLLQVLILIHKNSELDKIPLSEFLSQYKDIIDKAIKLMEV